MITGLRLLLIVSLAFILLGGCYNVSKYSGDGHLIDSGVSAATDRYVLNLGAIDLGRPGTKTYRIANLPETNFVAGIEIGVASKDRAIIETRAVSPTILLELSGVGGELVFAKQSKLATWTWSVPVGEPRAFIYGREGQATYFQPVPQTEYTLKLTVLQPDPSQSEYTALLLAKSGGWK